MIKATFQEGETSTTITDEVYQFDYGQRLQIEGLELPETVTVDFAFGNNASVESISQEGTTEDNITRVSVPDEMLSADQAKDYKVYIYVFETNEDDESGETTYVITMPVKTRPKRSSENNDNEGN